jgi:acyl-coenzyme A thioesterase PaaI-like protein
MPPTDLLDSLTATEARIISEDATYVVIAIRVEKASLQGFMQRNGHFIAALADVAPALVPDSETS